MILCPFCGSGFHEPEVSSRAIQSGTIYNTYCRCSHMFCTFSAPGGAWALVEACLIAGDGRGLYASADGSKTFWRRSGGLADEIQDDPESREAVFFDTVRWVAVRDVMNS